MEREKKVEKLTKFLNDVMELVYLDGCPDCHALHGPYIEENKWILKWRNQDCNDIKMLAEGIIKVLE